jgi:hypothetical protein
MERLDLERELVVGIAVLVAAGAQHAEVYKDSRGGQDVSASYTLKARNIRRRIQDAIHKSS